MSTRRTLAVALVSGIFAVLPFAALAQFSPSPACGYSAPSYSYANNNYNCGPQTLLVYLQVVNPTTGYNTATYAPSDFTVSVSGFAPSPASFAGSLFGTPVQLGVGGYSVTVPNAPAGLTASYSPGCSGTIYPTGQGPLCVITETSSYNYYNTPTLYPYPYTTPAPLACAPNYQTIDIGQSATFTVLNGTQETFYPNGLSAQSGYNWQTPDRSYLNIGPTLTTVFQSVGVQSVIVSNGTQTATCTVDVVGSAAPIVYSGSTPTATYIPAAYVVPTLPNTGFEPHSALAWAIALALLGIVGIALYPHVRKISLALLA
jgi:hypothetical protein